MDRAHYVSLSTSISNFIRSRVTHEDIILSYLYGIISIQAYSLKMVPCQNIYPKDHVSVQRGCKCPTAAEGSDPRIAILLFVITILGYFLIKETISLAIRKIRIYRQSQRSQPN
jgi:hypothetical protein